MATLTTTTLPTATMKDRLDVARALGKLDVYIALFPAKLIEWARCIERLADETHRALAAFDALPTAAEYDAASIRARVLTKRWHGLAVLSRIWLKDECLTEDHRVALGCVIEIIKDDIQTALAFI